MLGELLSQLADTVLGEYLRHLTLEPFENEEMFYITISPMFEAVLRNTKNLHSLTWNTHRAVHPNLIKLLQELHPSAKLHVILRHRKLTSLSSTLLSSPQLHSLDVAMYCIRSIMTRCHSELAFIQSCLGNSLKVLRLSVIQPSTYEDCAKIIDWDSVQEGVMNFDWQIDDQIPALEELTLQYESYDLDPAHCNMWAQTTSCTNSRD
jgi:hypothetical protein